MPHPVPKPSEAPRWAGANRRRRAPTNWWPTWIGIGLVIVGVTVHIILRETFDLVPLALIIVGAAMIDKEAVRAASKMLSIRRNGGSTEESPTHGDV